MSFSLSDGQSSPYRKRLEASGSASGPGMRNTPMRNPFQTVLRAVPPFPFCCGRAGEPRTTFAATKRVARKVRAACGEGRDTVTEAIGRRTGPRPIESRTLNWPRCCGNGIAAVTLTGPRQSGKSTLCREVFPRHQYVSLEETGNRSFAMEDPRGFLARLVRDAGESHGAVIDEIQYAPDLISSIQALIDEDQRGAASKPLDPHRLSESRDTRTCQPIAGGSHCDPSSPSDGSFGGTPIRRASRDARRSGLCRGISAHLRRAVRSKYLA